jgi:hypothetical protein
VLPKRDWDYVICLGRPWFLFAIADLHPPVQREFASELSEILQNQRPNEGLGDEEPDVC